MNRALLLRTVAAQLLRHRLTTALMALAIGFSVLAMATLQPFVASARAAFFRYVNTAYPADVIVLQAGEFMMGGGYGSDALRLTDVEAVLASIPEIAAWDPSIRAGSRDIKHAGRDVRVTVFGHSERAERARRRGVQNGDFFTRRDVETRARVALIGATTAERLFGNESPIGAQLFVDSLPVEVKGVLESIGVDPHGIDLDHVIFLPYTTVMDDLLGVDFLTAASLVLDDAARAEPVARRVEEVMRELHDIPQGYVDDFTVVTPVAVQQQLGSSLDTFGRLVGLIVATLFVVAGIIVLSTMLISIKQRSAEIGLRKALGARRRDLVLQIVLEVLALAAVASAVGLAAAWLATFFAAPVLAEQFGLVGLALSPPVVALSVAAAVLAALLGSIVPAYKAAGLDPIETLR